jgi:hypothetical protein
VVGSSISSRVAFHSLPLVTVVGFIPHYAFVSGFIGLAASRVTGVLSIDPDASMTLAPSLYFPE